MEIFLKKSSVKSLDLSSLDLFYLLKKLLQGHLLMFCVFCTAWFQVYCLTQYLHI